VTLNEQLVPAAVLHVHGAAVIPREICSLLKSGRLSTKEMPKSRFNALYQDHVCSAVLRVACELFAVLPARAAIVTAVDELLNTATGHLEESSILSVAIPRETVEQLDLERIDPSDSMCNFIHRMKFTKVRGFEAIEPVASSELSL